MKRKEGVVTHLSLGEFIQQERIPEPDYETAIAVRKAAIEICNANSKPYVSKKGYRGVRIELFPIEVLRQLEQNGYFKTFENGLDDK